MAKGSREQSTLRYFKEADIELAEVLLEAANRIVERRSKETTSTTAPAATRGRKPGNKNQPPAQPKPDTRQPDLPGVGQPDKVVDQPATAPEEEERAAYASQ